MRSSVKLGGSAVQPPSFQAAPQLSFQIVNGAEGGATANVIFVTDDARYNKLTLQISLTSGASTLVPGTIPDPSTPPTTGTTLYVDLSSLQLSAAAWSAMSFPDTTDWTYQKFADQGVLGMTPQKSIPLTAGIVGTLSIGINGVVIPKPIPSPQQLYVTYVGVAGVKGNYSTFAVAILNRPDASGNLADALGMSLSANGIVNSIVPLLNASNLFSLQFSSVQGAQVVAGPDTTFTVAFVCGAPKDQFGFGALTDVPNAKLIAAARGTNADGWAITRNTDKQTPSWTLAPPPRVPIVGTGAQGVVGIDFSNVVTYYQPGPTVMLISYANVPGYQDGTFSLILNKVPHVQIQALTVDPNPACFLGGSANVLVSWTALQAQGLELSQNYQSTSVTGQSQIQAVLDAESTVFTLKATGVPGTVENVDYRSVQAIALPVINSFVASPTEIYSGSLQRDAKFAWAVDSSDGVTLSSTGDAFSGQSFDKAGSTSAAIKEPQMVTLAPTTAANPLSLTRKVVISAFTPTPSAHDLPFTPSAVAASPTGPFVVMANPATNSLAVADTIQYTPSSSVTVNTGHPASSIAFSQDGATLATTNTDNTVSIVSVTLGLDGNPIFGLPALVTLNAQPQHLVFGPKGPRIFVTVDLGPNTAGQVVSLFGLQGTYQIEGMVTVGIAPRGLTLDASGGRLFVANSGDDTVSMIGLTSLGALGDVQTIHQITGGPTGIAATSSGRQLLVSCAKAGTVVAIDPNHPDTGQRQTLKVGSQPGPIAMTPTGAYAFVTNLGDGTVSLLNCGGLPSAAEVLGSPIATGTRPTDVSMSPDGLQVFVAKSGGFSLITLATYHPLANAPSTPNQPTSIEVSPDGVAVFAWHDASIPAVSPSPGILVYAPSSGLVSPVLASQEVLRCVASPNPRAKQAIAIVKGDPALYLIATDTLETSSLTAVAPPGTSPVALAISGDGATLFVVVSTATHELSLIILQLQSAGWTTTQALPLYRATSGRRFLLRSTPDGTTVFLADVDAATVRVVQLLSQRYALSPTVITGGLKALDVAVLPDGSTAYVLNAGPTTNTVTVVDTATLTSRVAAIPQSYVNLTALQPSPDGRRLFASDSNAGALRMLDPRSLRILQTIPLNSTGGLAGGAAGLAVMPDGSKIFTANTGTQNLSIVEQIQMGTAPQRQRTAAAEAYSGLFMRHQLGATPSSPTDGWAASPDVIPYGLNIAPDPTIFTSADGYSTGYSNNVYTQNANYFYVRGLNTTGAPIKSRAYFFYTQGSLAMWPGNWSSSGVMVNGAAQNWVDIEAPANGVGVCPTPLIWEPAPLSSSDHYCVGAWVDNSPNPQPPDFKSWASFAYFDQLVQFVQQHSNLAWRNTVEVTRPPPDLKYTTGIEIKDGGGSVYLSMTFPNVPLDGTFAVNMQGTDTSNSVALPQSSLANYQGGYTPKNNPMTFPSKFSTSLQVTHWPGPTPLPLNAQIRIVLAVQTAPALMRDIERSCQRHGRPTPYRLFGGIPVFVLGTTIYNLKFGATGARREMAR